MREVPQGKDTPKVQAQPTPQKVFLATLIDHERIIRFQGPGHPNAVYARAQLERLFQKALDTPTIPPDGTIEYRAYLYGVLVEVRDRLPAEQYGNAAAVRGILDALHSRLLDTLRRVARQLGSALALHPEEEGTDGRTKEGEEGDGEEGAHEGESRNGDGTDRA